MVVQLAAPAGEPIATVFDPTDERLVDRDDVLHRPVVDNRSHLDGRKVDDADAVAVRDFVVGDVESGVDDDAPVVGRILVPGDHDPGRGSGAPEMVEYFGHETFEHGVEVVVPEAGGGGRRFGDADGFGRLDGDVEAGHGDAPFAVSSIRLFTM